MNDTAAAVAAVIALFLCAQAFRAAHAVAVLDLRPAWQIEADAYAMRIPTGDEWGR